jgi:hypothetical protein
MQRYLLGFSHTAPPLECFCGAEWGVPRPHNHRFLFVMVLLEANTCCLLACSNCICKFTECKHPRMHTHKHIHTHVRTCTHTHTHIYACTLSHTHAHTCTYARTLTHTCTHMHIRTHRSPWKPSVSTTTTTPLTWVKATLLAWVLRQAVVADGKEKGPWGILRMLKEQAYWRIWIMQSVGACMCMCVCFGVCVSMHMCACVCCVLCVCSIVWVVVCVWLTEVSRIGCFPGLDCSSSTSMHAYRKWLKNAAKRAPSLTEWTKRHCLYS